MSILDMSLMYGYMGIHMDISWISHGSMFGYPYKISTQDIHHGYVTNIWIYGDPHLMEICLDVHTRYPLKISILGMSWIHGYMEISMDNIGYLMDIQF